MHSLHLGTHLAGTGCTPPKHKLSPHSPNVQLVFGKATSAVTQETKHSGGKGYSSAYGIPDRTRVSTGSFSAHLPSTVSLSYQSLFTAAEYIEQGAKGGQSTPCIVSPQRWSCSDVRRVSGRHRDGALHLGQHREQLRAVHLPQAQADSEEDMGAASTLGARLLLEGCRRQGWKSGGFL